MLSLTKRYASYKRLKDWSTKRKPGYYLIVWLYNWLFKKRFYVHRLVAIAFINRNIDWLQVNHIDWDHSNNYVSNLEWVTIYENIYHSHHILSRWNYKPIEVYKDWILFSIFKSTRECCDHLKLYPHYISYCLNWHKKSYKWYTFKYNSIWKNFFKKG